jgi:hypothetical protein
VYCGIDVNERTGVAKKSVTEIVKYYYRWHILKPSGKRKKERSFTVSVKIPKWTEEEATMKSTTEAACFLDFKMKMNRCALVSISHMRKGLFSLKARLNGFNIMSTADCESGDRLHAEEHVF